MSPSKNARRAGVIATGTFLLAMAASPAYALGGLSNPLVPGAPCTSLTQIPASLNLKCVNDVLQQIPVAAPTTAPAPAPAPNPVGGVAKGVGGAVGKTLSGATGAAGSTVGGVTKGLSGGGSSSGGGLGGLPVGAGSLPSAPAPVPTPTPTSGAKGAAGGGAAESPAGSHGSTTSDGSSLLGPAAAFLPGGSIASFADLGSGGGSESLAPLADNIPSPELASPEAKLAAVQAPLIAAGERAASKDNSVLARFAGKALPGILVVLGTAMVAAVGAGNIRAWQARIAAKREAAAAT